MVTVVGNWGHWGANLFCATYVGFDTKFRDRFVKAYLQNTWFSCSTITYVILKAVKNH
jgi:hypothetical protein